MERGHDAGREPPFFFQTNPDNLDPSGEFPYPPHTSDVHHQVGLAVPLKSGGTDIGPDAALDHVQGYTVALDMTRRELQREMKKVGRPWKIGGAFERSAPVGPNLPAAVVGNPVKGRIALKINGELRQEGDLNQMIWKVPEMISYLSAFFTLAAGQVILTGTPAGVGPVVNGDVLGASVDRLPGLSVRIVKTSAFGCQDVRSIRKMASLAGPQWRFQGGCEPRRVCRRLAGCHSQGQNNPIPTDRRLQPLRMTVRRGRGAAGRGYAASAA